MKSFSSLSRQNLKTKSKKSADSIKKNNIFCKELNGIFDIFCRKVKNAKLKLQIYQNQFLINFLRKCQKKLEREAICKFEEGYVEITFDCHLKGHLFGNYLNNLAIGDTILKTSFLDKGCEKGIRKLNWIRRGNFRECLRSLFELWEVSASEIVKKNIRHTLSCESYKTIECEESECDEASCIFYHSEMDRRRNPYSVPYGSGTCKFICSGETCIFGDECRFAHNDYEFMFHPSEIYFKLCDDNKTRKQCFSVNPLCARAHRDIRIFMMGASMPFLDNVRKSKCEPLLFGTPSKFLKRIGHLVVLPFTLIIVSQVDVLLSIRKERKALINFFARCQMTFSPQHKVKFDHDVPCTPFALNALPKWLDTGSNPSQVYPFLSAEVAKSVVEGNKKKLENTPWLRKETFYSSDSSECSDSSELTSSHTEDDRRSNRRGEANLLYLACRFYTSF
ncbi:hypothetical protein Avbf_05384 [Armadillidium vulgare]|nr:hypothetical protein Avbf_05384 [Armadillidium vulgare]